MTSGVFRIAHISDTHISPEYNRHNISKLRRLLGYVVDMAYDHVVITGDITGHGESRDFRSVRRLLKYFGLLDYNKLTVTVGNHDIFGGVHKVEDVMTFGKHCSDISYRSKMVQFERAFRETFPAKAFENERLFPFVKIVGPVAFIGMNSVRDYHPLLNPVGSNGLVSTRQIESATKFLDHPLISGMTKIVLIHHHFGPYRPYSPSRSGKLLYILEGLSLRLHGKRRLEEFFKMHGVSAVLHGHTHVEGLYSRSGIQFSSTALDPIPASENAGTSADMYSGTLSFNEVVVTKNSAIDMARVLVPTRKPIGKSQPLAREVLR